MPSHNLTKQLKELEARIVEGRALGSSSDAPFAVLAYQPGDELFLRREIDLLATRLGTVGHPVTQVDLGSLMWDCFAEHPLGGVDGLIESERMSPSLDAVLAEAKQLLVGPGQQPGPLERKVMSRLEELDEERDLAFLVRAAELFPLYRTSALLERLIGGIRVRTVLFYPGTLYPGSQLSFMGVFEPSPRYRVPVLNGI